ncbi:MAG: hypothetical protein KY445_16955, partial [Armatimonadetes bacterium]|nr:hypothetical protein [Armatimonadota bacterium]
MQCPFCQAVNARSTGACRVCGGPLRGTNFQPPAPRRKPDETAALPTFGRTREPLLSAPPAAPVLLVRRAVEKSAPRMVAALWNGHNDSMCPLLVPQSGALQLWDVPRDALHLLAARRLFHKPSMATCAAFAPVCGVVATGHESGQVHLQRLEPEAGGTQWKLHALASIETHRGRVLALATEGTRLYSAGSDGAVVLTRLPDAPNLKWASKGNPEMVLDGLDTLSSLALSPNGRLMALGGDDGQVQMWH